MPKLLVFGGNGFVGSQVCQEALNTGLQIVSINRSGRPKGTEAWKNEVEWVTADVFDVARWRSQLEGTIGLVSCLGAFGGNDFMYKICGESNALIFREAAAAGVARASFISVADYKLPDMFLRGYFSGKRYAERVLHETFPDSGVALRPGFIHGTRNVRGIGIPLGAIGLPLQKVLSYTPSKELAKYPGLALGFVPPVSVQAVAKAAVAAATDSIVPAGTLDCWEIQKFGTT
jgi:uncharacterized protein YbjT (DUF2867 family)